jgi:hypothetical protein
MAEFSRNKGGERLDFHGMDILSPVDLIPKGRYPFAQNIRRYVAGAIKGRNLLTNAIYTLASAVHSLCRINDSTPAGPASGYSLISGSGTTLNVWNTTIGGNGTNVATGLSGNPLSLIPFRPNTSVQPWCYSGDSAPMGNVEITTEYLSNNTPTTYATYGMTKTRSDGRIYRSGIQEPPLAPIVSTQNSNIPIIGTLEATAIPWTNYAATNPNTNYAYGETNGYPHPVSGRDGTKWFNVDCANASFITINSITGTATINGNSSATPTTNGPVPATSNPGYYVMAKRTGTTPPVSATVVIGAFTDGAGNVIPAGVVPLYIPSVVDVGAAIGIANGITVPYGAQAFQIGINSTGNTFNSNSGSFNLNLTVTTYALPTVTAILGTLTAYYWGDSPTSGPVGQYIWKNPDDPGGSGPTRSTSSADGSTTGNSFIFDATFVSGIPQLPGIGTESLPMMWTSLSPESVVIGSNPVFAAPITTTYPKNIYYDNFNFCLTGSIYFPSGGNFTLVLTSKDDVIWGIGGGVKIVSATAINQSGSVGTSISGQGQTITVVGGYPLLPRGNWTGGHNNSYQAVTAIVSVPAAGIYPIEIDYDYWYSTSPGRILLLMASPTAGGSPTIIPPLPSNIRQDVQYRYVYRSSATGATSNPSPESTAEAVPVVANTITSVWSPDPQVDVVDYYRIDSVTANFTYVNTGPNDNAGNPFSSPGNNTPVTDSLLDTELGTQLLNYDNYEPFPSIDLPQKGTCIVTGGVITWVSGGAGFNIRWLAGTEILIGSPTSLAYTLIARPTSTSSMTIPGVPDGGTLLSPLTYEIPEPILAAQPLPYMWGPTDNINFTYAVGDPLRPGTLYWCNGSNLDAAADTNQTDVTDPGEPLVNGAIAGGLGVLFSIKRGWLIVPNFTSATSTATGTTGSPWTLQESSITRGLYMPRCVCVSGGGKIYFRVDDGIHISIYGSASKSITDEDLYPLFPHENEDGGTSTPQPVTIAGYTIYPPNDSLPESQRFSWQNGYMYYDYIGTDSNPHTLVFDEAAMGWVWDLYTPPATIHAANEGQSAQGVLVGCNDGTVRQMASGGTEVATAVLLTPAFDKGDTRATAKFADLYIETENP